MGNGRDRDETGGESCSKEREGIRKGKAKGENDAGKKGRIVKVEYSKGK